MFFRRRVKPEQVVSWVQRNFRNILFVLSFLSLTALAFIGWSWREERQERKIQDSLYGLQHSLKKLLKEDDQGAKNLTNILESLKEKAPPPFTSEMKDKAFLYEQAIRQNQSRPVSVIFAIDLADFYYQRGEREKARELLSLFAFPTKPSHSYHLASFQLASYYMSDKKCEKALPLLSAIQKNEKAGYFHLESQLQQALCLEYLSRYEQALNKYEDIINKDPEGYTGRLARDYKKLLVLKRNLKEKK